MPDEMSMMLKFIFNYYYEHAFNSKIRKVVQQEVRRMY